MRIGWLLLAVAAAAFATPLDDEIIDGVFASWNDGPITVASHFWQSKKRDEQPTHHEEEHNEFTFETAEHHGRSKRAANPFLNAAAVVTRACNTPGYTGANCLIPICMEANTAVRDPTSAQDANIDAAFLGTKCDQTYITVIDETLAEIVFTITSDGDIYPDFTLKTDPNAQKEYFFDELVQRGPSILSGKYFSLPPGTYYVIPTPSVNDARCNVKIQGKTRLTIQGGFVTGETWQTDRSDYPDPKYTYQYTLNTFVAHPSNLRAPGSLAAVSLVKGSNEVSHPKPLMPRYGCNYEYFYDSFFCTDTGDYFYLVEGISWAGYPFRRLAPFQCLYNTNRPTPAPTGSTPVPTSPSACSNGGMLVTNPDGSAFCVCRGLWTGDSCSDIICMNGGSNTGGINCQCPAGYQGRHCQDVVCNDRGRVNFNVDKPALVFAIRVRKQMQDVIDQVRKAMSDFVNELSIWQPEYLTNFGLVFYLDGGIKYAGGFKSLSETLAAFDTYASNLNTNIGNCTDIEFAALVAALGSTELSPRSKIYLISDAMPQDYAESLETVFQLDSYFRVPIFFLYIVPQPGNLCYPDLHDPGFRAMDDITQRTMGLAIYVENRTDVYNIIYKHLYWTFYRSQLLLNDDLEVCANQNTFKSIAVDTNVDQLVFVARGKQLTPFFSGDGVANLVLEYSGNDLNIWTANGLVAGNYWVNFLTGQALSGCSYRIYQRAYHAGDASLRQFELFWQFTDALNSDGYFQQPVIGLDTGIVMHLKNFPERIPPQMVQAELLIEANRGGRQIPLYLSNGLWRDGCDFNFYFPPFTCRTRETLHFQFFTRNALGFSIQRSGSMYCSEYHPTPQPPNGCQNGGVPSPTDNSTCFCPPGYTGNMCEKLVCWNGGTAGPFFCSCPPGFVGTHCEITSCIEKGPRPDIFIHGVDMVFAIEMTTTAFGQIVYLNKMFPEIVRDMSSMHRDWIRNFVLLGYNSTWGGVVAESPAYDQNTVITALNSIANNYNGLDNTEACNVTVKTWHALTYALLHRQVRPGSYINLFTASKPDQTEIMDIAVMYNAVREMRIQMTAVIGYQATGGGSFFCNNTLDAYQLIHDACRFSNGESYFLQHASVEGYVRAIPMKYMSGVVAHRRFDDCTGGVYVSVPVDAYTQTLTIAVEGFKADVGLYDVRGNKQTTTTGFVKFDTDTVSGWNFYSQRALCDPDWEEVGSYCMHFSLNEYTYDEASTACHSGGGMLADDLTSDKHNYLLAMGSNQKFWFGLNQRNGSGWVWDRETGVAPQPYNGSISNYWNGGSAPTDQTKQCAFFDSSVTTGNWNADACANKKYFVCQKHAYDYNYEPNRVDDDDLPAGKWYLKVQTTFPDATTKLSAGCFVEVRAQSHLQVYTGYTEDTHADYPGRDPISGSTKNHIIGFVDSAASYKQRTPILTHGLIFNAHNDTMYDAVTFQPRGMCSFDWISQEFACPDSENPDNLFSVIHLGEDEYGNTFQRILNGHCEKPTITCGNGGLRYNGTCVCTEYWQGRYCSIPVCVNGGQLDQTNSRCQCPSGFGGDACQYELCTNPMNVTFDNSGTSLVFLLEVTQQNKETLNQLVTNLAATLNSLPSGWFGNYVLTTFNSQGVQFSQSFRFVDSLIPSILSQIDKITDTASCSLPIYAAIGKVFDNPYVGPGAQLVLVSSSVPSDSAANAKSTIEKITGASPNIHNFYSASSCNNNAEIPTSADAVHLQRFAYATDGNNFFVDSTSIADAISKYLPSLYQSNTLAHPTYLTNFTCSTSDNWYIQVDNNSTDIYVTVSSAVGSLSVYDPGFNPVTATPIFSKNSQKLYHIQKTNAGIYTFTLSSPGACFVNIQASGGAAVWNAFVQPSSADPTGSHTDQITLDAVAGSNVAVFHLEGLERRQRGWLTYMTMWDPKNQKAVFSELYRRGNCHFEYYSDPFTCTDNEYFYMWVNGVDELGQNFRRQVTAFCLQSAPTPGTTTTTPAAPGTTQSGLTTLSTTPFVVPTTSYSLKDIQLDLVFAIDSSSTAQPNFDDYISFIKTFLVPFTISQEKTRVGIVSVAGDEDAVFPIAPLSAINSREQVFSYLNDLKTQYSDFDDNGQYLGEALDLIASTYIGAGSGYRDTIVNHLIIYLTSNTAFSDAALAQQNSAYLRSHNKFGIIGISYKGGDRAPLTTITGGSSCTYLPTTPNGLMTSVLSAVQSIVFDNDNTGAYCKG